MASKVKPAPMDDARVEEVRRAIDEALPHLEPTSAKYRADPAALRRAVKRDPRTGEKLLRVAR